MKHIQPKVFENSFTCPHCGVLSKQRWSRTSWDLEGVYPMAEQNQLRVGHCDHCNENSVWIMNKMYYPENGSAPFPNPDLPERVKKLYVEAASISSKSPRGAAALLRLGVQILCAELGEEGKNINTDIKELVKKGLPQIVQKSLDVVRVTGNDAVHPGQIDTDDIDVVNQLFKLTNVIAEYMISLPNEVSGIYDALPSEKKKGIEDRDK
ncbi:DUF4145 domain-containing protein [Brumimicrobium sp.]|uniref:DUF4145 domain-containing protein n=1 Tax=Brumimicrobium sp. TaxID=2029867 RepID=UPI003A8F6AB6